MWLLAILVLFEVKAATPSPSECFEKFLSKYRSGYGYRTDMRKTELAFGDPIIENITITEDRKKSTLELLFTDKGTTGIKNNGMTITYTGQDQADIELGKSRGFGAFVNGMATIFVRKKRHIFDRDMVKDQVFTVNRAGFGFLAQILSKKMSELKSGSLGKLSSTGKFCDIEFVHDASLVENIALGPTSDIRKIEENFATLAFLIYQANTEKFKKFHNFLRPSSIREVLVPKAFTDFKVQFDREYSPIKLVLLSNKRPLGIYEFSNTTYF